MSETKTVRERNLSVRNKYNLEQKELRIFEKEYKNSQKRQHER